jgi:hypothetical protein
MTNFSSTNRWLSYVLVLLSLLGAPAATYAQAPTWQWGLQSTNPTPTDDTEAFGRAIVTDAAGNSYVAGDLNSSPSTRQVNTRSFGASTLASTQPGSGFVGKVSAAGQWQWARLVAADGDGAGATQVVTSPMGELYLGGYMYGPTLTIGPTTHTHAGLSIGYFVAKLSTDGQVQWVVSVANLRSLCLAYDPSTSGLVAAGTYTAPAIVGSTTLPVPTRFPTSLFVARLSAAGQWLSATAASGTADFTTPDATGIALVVGPQGHALISGNYKDGDLVLGGITLPQANGGGFMAQLSPLGQWQWATSTAGTTLTGLAYGSVGGVWACGYGPAGTKVGSSTLAGNGTTVGFVGKVGSTGAWGTVTGLGANTGTRRAGSATFRKVLVDAAGNALALATLDVDYASNNTAADFSFGSQTISLPDSRDARSVVARLSPAGQWQYVVPLPAGSIGNGAYVDAMALDASGAVLSTGGLRGALTLGSTSLAGSYAPTSNLYSAYGGDVLVAKLSNAAVPLAVRQAGGTTLLALYPNPVAAGAPATLRLPAPATAPTPLTLRDALGRAVRAAAMPAAQQEAVLPTAGLAPGLYLLEAGTSRAQLLVK